MGGSAQKRLPGAWAWAGTGTPRRIFGWSTLPLRCLIGVGVAACHFNAYNLVSIYLVHYTAVMIFEILFRSTFLRGQIADSMQMQRVMYCHI